MEPFHVFVSYSSDDREMAEQVHRHLSEAFRVWLDKARLRAGCDWHRDIEEACENSRVILPVLTAAWRRSAWTRFETYGGEYVIPLWFDGDWDEVAPPPLHGRQFVDFRQIDDADWRELVEQIRTFLRQPPPDKQRCLVSVPILPNRYFAGRESILVELHEALFQRPSAALTQGGAYAVTGLGGVGKTTLARQYAEKFYRLYRDIVWITAKPETIESQFARIAANLKWVDEPSKEAVDAQVALRELSTSKRRLLILDNAEDELSVAPWIPAAGGCHTIVTSRFSQWSAAMTALSVDVLEPNEALAFLRSRLGEAALQGDSGEAARRLCDVLGCLPLALEQAAATIDKLKVSIGHYLQMYDESRRELLADHALGSNQYPDSVATTWLTSMQQLGCLPRAVLQISAFLAPQSIPRTLFEGEGDRLLEACRLIPDADPPDSTPSKLAVRQALAELDRFSLITLHTDDFSVHRLVQTVTADRLTREQCGQWAAVAARLVNDVFPRGEHFENWPTCQQLLPHVLSLDEHYDPYGGDPEALGRLLCEAASYRRERYQLDAAEPLAERSLQLRRAALGEDHPDVAESLYQRGWVEQRRGNREQAIRMYGDALALFESTVGDDDPRLSDVLDNLGIAHDDEGRHDEAEGFYLRCLANRVRLFGMESRDVASTKHNLATNYHDRELYERSEELFTDALQTFRITAPADDPRPTRTMHWLAGLYERRGDLEAASTMRSEALDILIRAVGHENQETVNALSSVASFHVRNDEADRALAACDSFLRDATEKLGAGHVGTSGGWRVRASVHVGLGQIDSAIDAFQQARQALEQAFASKDRELATVRMDLASLFDVRGEYREGREHAEAAVRISAALGEDERSLQAAALNRLGTICHHGLDLVAAEDHYRAALALVEDRTAPRNDVENGSTLAVTIRNSLGAFLAEQRRIEESLTLLHRSLLEVLPGGWESHPELPEESWGTCACLAEAHRLNEELEIASDLASAVIRSVVNARGVSVTNLDQYAACCQTLAEVHLVVYQLEHATAICEESLRIRRHRQCRHYIGLSLDTLSRIHSATDNLNDADAAYGEWIELLGQLHGDQHFVLIEPLHRLAGIARRQGDESRAAALEARAEEIRRSTA